MKNVSIQELHSKSQGIYQKKNPLKLLSLTISQDKKSAHKINYIY